MSKITIEFNDNISDNRLEALIVDIQSQCEEDSQGTGYGVFTIQVE